MENNTINGDIFPADFISALSEKQAEQDSAKLEAVSAIRKIEAKLQSLLNGKSLPCAPELGAKEKNTRHGVRSYKAWRVRGKVYDKALSDNYSLCLTNAGKLEFAAWPDYFIETLRCTDKDLAAEDLQEVLDLLGVILPEITEKLREQHRKYLGIKELARKISESLD